MATLTRTLIIACLLSGSAFAQQVPETRFLLPFYRTSIPGAHGSQWVVENAIYNSGPGDPVVLPWPLLPCPFTCQIGLTVDAGWSPIFFNYMSNLGGAADALLVSVQAEFAGNVRFQSRIRDVSRESDSAGTEVPVVPEDDFVERPHQLLNIPRLPKFRHTLRIYALPEVSDPEVEIRYFRMPADRREAIEGIYLLGSERVRLDTYPLTLAPNMVTLSGIESRPVLAGIEKFWVEVAPVTPGLRIWAFLSITNDETQQVTLITP